MMRELLLIAFLFLNSLLASPTPDLTKRDIVGVSSFANKLTRHISSIQTVDCVLELSRPSRSPALSRRQLDQIIETTSQTAYETEVTIDGANFNLLVDTGSSHTWVTSPNYTCPSERCTFQHSLRIPASKHWLAPFFSGYADGSNATGGLISRPVSIAGITIKDQVIGLADRVHSTFQEGQWDGLLGLGGMSGTETEWNTAYPPVFISMMEEGLIPENSFSITLLGTADVEEPRDLGLLAFGGIPKKIVPTSEWGTARILTDAFYTIQVDSFMFPGSDTIELDEAQKQVIVDSGTFLTRLPKLIADAVFNLLPGTGKPHSPCKGEPNEKCLDESGFWEVPCSGKLPSFSVVVGGVALPITAKNLVVDIGNGICISGIVRQRDGSVPILGDTFMKNVIVYHDFRDPVRSLMRLATYTLEE